MKAETFLTEWYRDNGSSLDNRTLCELMEFFAREVAIEFAKYINSIPAYVNYFPDLPVSTEKIFDQWQNQNNES